MAFDQYGKLTKDLEEQTELREKAETIAMEVQFGNALITLAF